MSMLRQFAYLSFIAFVGWSACLISCLFHEHYLRTGASQSGYGADFTFPAPVCVAILAVIVYTTRKSWYMAGFWNKLTCFSVSLAVLCLVPMLLGQL